MLAVFAVCPVRHNDLFRIAQLRKKLAHRTHGSSGVASFKVTSDFFAPEIEAHAVPVNVRFHAGIVCGKPCL